MTADDPADVLLRAVGRRIGEIRRSAGLTQEQTAERLGISVRAYGYIESGRENLTLRTMVAVAAALGVPVADLLLPPQTSEAKRGRPRKRAVEEAGWSRSQGAAEAEAERSVESDAKLGRPKRSRA